MANRVQHLRGSHTEHSTFTGEKGEISLVTDTSSNRIPTGELRVHDGTTAGGLPVKLGTTDKPLTSNIVMGSGYGIDFASYATSGNPSSNLLDDYEEGTWTPAPVAGSGTVAVPTGNRDQGHYMKIGSLVIAQMDWYNNTSGAVSYTGTLKVTGLPFTCNRIGLGDSGEPFSEVNVLMDNFNQNLSTDSIVSILGLGVSGTEFFIYGQKNSALTSLVSDMAPYLRVNTTNPSHIRATIVYRTSS